MKRSARHSVDAEIPDQLITHFYPVDDNYDPHPTDPTLRCAKSLTDLCGKFVLLSSAFFCMHSSSSLIFNFKIRIHSSANHLSLTSQP